MPVLCANSRLTGWHLDRLLESSLVVHQTSARKKHLSSLLERVEEVIVLDNHSTHHRSERRLGRVLRDLSALSCAWSRVCKSVKPDHLLYEMEYKYCIKCNKTHWFFVKEIPFEQTEFNPNDHWTWQLEEMGFFDKAQDTNRPND